MPVQDPSSLLPYCYVPQRPHPCPSLTTGLALEILIQERGTNTEAKLGPVRKNYARTFLQILLLIVCETVVATLSLEERW
jgi:hypothetical protein